MQCHWHILGELYHADCTFGNLCIYWLDIYPIFECTTTLRCSMWYSCGSTWQRIMHMHSLHIEVSEIVDKGRYCQKNTTAMTLLFQTLQTIFLLSSLFFCVGTHEYTGHSLSSYWQHLTALRQAMYVGLRYAIWMQYARCSNRIQCKLMPYVQNYSQRLEY